MAPARQAVATPTPRAVALAGAGVLVALAVGVLAPARWPLALLWAAFTAFAVLADFALAARPDSLSAQVVAPAAVALGSEAKVEVRLQAGRAPVSPEAALAADPRLAPFPRVLPLDGGAAAFRLRPLRRGRPKLAALQLRWSGPLGLVRRRSDVELDREVMVTPDLAQARAAAKAFDPRGRGGPKLALRRGEGSEFRALRAYASGDDRRMIDWKRSAGRGELLVKEFQLEQNHPVVLALDAGRQMAEPILGRPRIDHALASALALAYAGLAVGDRIRLMGFDDAVRVDGPFVAGPRAFAQLQALGSRIDYSTEAANYTLALHTLAASLDRRALVVVFTEFTDTIGAELMLEAAGRLVRRHAVLFVVFHDAELEVLVSAAPEAPEDVSRAVVAASLLKARALVVERLRRLGVRVVETAPQRMGGALIDAYLDIKRRELG